MCMCNRLLERALVSSGFRLVFHHMQPRISYVVVSILLSVVVGVLGHGSFSTVYRAFYKPLGQTVALKVIKRDVSRDASRQLAAELRSLQRTPNECGALVRVLDAFFSDGSVSVLLEYMGGGSLSQALRRAPRRRLPNESAAALCARCVLHGLHYLHKTLHVIHRDIKPANLVGTTIFLICCKPNLVLKFLGHLSNPCVGSWQWYKRFVVGFR